MKWHAFILAATLPASAADFDPTPYQFTRFVEGGELQGLSAIPLDEHILRHAETNGTDLKLVEGEGDTLTELPYLIEKQERRTGGSAPREIPTKVSSFVDLPNDVIEIEVALLEQALVAATLRIETPLDDFQKRIVVSGSDDGETWEAIVDDGLIVDRSNFFDFRRDSISLPANTYRHFRVRIREATDEQVAGIREVTRTSGGESPPRLEETTQVKTRPFRVDRLVFLTAEVEPEIRDTGREYPLEITSRSVDEETGETVLSIHADNLPLTGFRFETEASNFHRKVEVRAKSGSSETWQTVLRSSIHEYSIASLQEERLDVGFPEKRAEKWELRIQQVENAPVEVDAITGLGDAYRMVALSGPDSVRRLYYGVPGEAAPPIDYDVSALRRALADGVEVREVGPGEVEDNPLFAPKAAPKDPMDLSLAIWLVMGLAVVILGWIIVKTGRRLEEIEPNE